MSDLRDRFHHQFFIARQVSIDAACINEGIDEPVYLRVFRAFMILFSPAESADPHEVDVVGESGRRTTRLTERWPIANAKIDR